MKTSPTTGNLIAALMTAQREIMGVPLIKDASNPDVNSKYIQLGSLLNVLKPICLNNGLLITQGGGDNITDGLLIAISIETTVFHTSGEWLSQTVTIPLVGRKKAKADGGGTHAPDAQSGGGAITYGCRYGLIAFFDLAIDKDDDGARASLSRRRAVGRLSGGAASAVQPTEWHEAGIMAIGDYAGTPMVQLKKERLRRALDAAKTAGKLDVATAISAELTRRATTPGWKEPETEPEKPGTVA